MAGLAVLGTVWMLPLADWLGAFPGHMLRHMGIVALAAPLLALTLPIRTGAGLALTATLAEAVVVWGWHLPGARALAESGVLWAGLEQVSFLAAGLAVWAGALGAREPLAGAGALLLTSMHMTLLGALLILAPSDLYALACGRPPNLAGQQAGGMLMLALGTPVYLAAGLARVAHALRGAPA